MTRANAPGAPPTPLTPVSVSLSREPGLAVAGQQWRVSRAPQPHILYDKLKRVLDVTLSLILLAAAQPVLIVACVAIVASARQNPLLVQRRVGLLGQEFGMLKLRTMRAGLSEEPEAPSAAREVLASKTPEDPRVTAIGRLLRRTSIDELPQLLNVLMGHMSLVGPRPALPVEVARYPKSWQRRLAVKPGLTGLWQVSGRSAIAPARRTAMDRAYISNRSIAFDCLILLRTVRATVSMRGAW